MTHRQLRRLALGLYLAVTGGRTAPASPGWPPAPATRRGRAECRGAK